MTSKSIIISVHLPKTAGSSFLQALQSHFGSRLKRDYGDYPLHESSGERIRHALERGDEFVTNRLDETACVHGHFLPIKYRALDGVRDTTYVTWMREPVDRLISHYHYWIATYQPSTSAPLHRRVVEEEWTLEDFCMSEELRNVYAAFLWNFPLERFAFVGVMEHFDEDLDDFALRFLGSRLAKHRENIRGSAATPPTPATRQRIETFHEEDVLLYHKAVELRSNRISRVSDNRR